MPAAVIAATDLKSINTEFSQILATAAVHIPRHIYDENTPPTNTAALNQHIRIRSFKLAKSLRF
jgi:hypothetical protein